MYIAHIITLPPLSLLCTRPISSLLLHCPSSVPFPYIQFPSSIPYVHWPCSVHIPNIHYPSSALSLYMSHIFTVLSLSLLCTYPKSPLFLLCPCYLHVPYLHGPFSVVHMFKSHISTVLPLCLLCKCHISLIFPQCPSSVHVPFLHCPCSVHVRYFHCPSSFLYKECNWSHSYKFSMSIYVPASFIKTKYSPKAIFKLNYICLLGFLFYFLSLLHHLCFTNNKTVVKYNSLLTVSESLYCLKVTGMADCIPTFVCGFGEKHRNICKIK